MLNFTLLNFHETYMRRCLELARLGMGSVSPNPMVGAVLVYDNKIIGEGCHMRYGGPHAEVNCIDSVSEENRSKIQSSVLYVSLEPCSHHGKTPPCVELILKYQIKEVVVACKDPNEKVSGSGIKKLADEGVKVTFGILEKEAIELNKRFFVFHQKKRPYIILKWAQSSDEKISSADKRPVKISNEFTDRLSHQWRTEEDAIMVGTNTALSDNPSLTARLSPGKNPVRIFIDKQLKVSTDSHLLDNSSTTIILNEIKEEKNGNNHFVLINKNQSLISQCNDLLFKLGIMSLIVEGGTILLQSFIDENMWDESRVITNNILTIDNGYPSPRLKNNELFHQINIENDEVSFYTNSTMNRL